VGYAADKNEHTLNRESPSNTTRDVEKSILRVLPQEALHVQVKPPGASNTVRHLDEKYRIYRNDRFLNHLFLGPRDSLSLTAASRQGRNPERELGGVISV
jgi:hypothetical protein